MLTQKQHDLLQFIETHQNQTGVSPSFDEMKDALNLKSKSGIHRLIGGLEERGFIRRLPNRARALEILRSSADAPHNTPNHNQQATIPSPPPQTPQTQTSPQQTTAQVTNLQTAQSNAGSAGDDTQSLPLYGRIAAGTPIEAISDQSNYVNVPTHLLGRGEYYALEIDGQSMIEAGILDGDTIIVERTQTAHNGDIVVALVDNEEATLKTFRKQGNTVLLEPANRDYETQMYDANRVNIQGRLAGLIRLY